MTRKELEQEVEKLRREALRHASEQGRWLYEKAGLMRVIFQLSEALQHEKTH